MSGDTPSGGGSRLLEVDVLEGTKSAGIAGFGLSIC